MENLVMRAGGWSLLALLAAAAAAFAADSGFAGTEAIVAVDAKRPETVAHTRRSGSPADQIAVARKAAGAGAVTFTPTDLNFQ